MRYASEVWISDFCGRERIHVTTRWQKPQAVKKVE